jgi:hypothetical protein
MKFQLFFMMNLPADFFSEDYFTSQTLINCAKEEIESSTFNLISIDILPASFCETLAKTLVILNRAFFSSHTLDDDLSDITLYDGILVSENTDDGKNKSDNHIESSEGNFYDDGNNGIDNNLNENMSRKKMDIIHKESRAPSLTSPDTDTVEYIPHPPESIKNLQQSFTGDRNSNIKESGVKKSMYRPGRRYN